MKCHPDVNRKKDTDLKMRQMNGAYEVLRAPEKKKDDGFAGHSEPAAQGGSHPNNAAHEESAVPPKKVLDRYFACIKDRHYDKAHEIISCKDKSRHLPTPLRQPYRSLRRPKKQLDSMNDQRHNRRIKRERLIEFINALSREKELLTDFPHLEK